MGDPNNQQNVMSNGETMDGMSDVGGARVGGRCSPTTFSPLGRQSRTWWRRSFWGCGKRWSGWTWWWGFRSWDFNSRGWKWRRWSLTSALGWFQPYAAPHPDLWNQRQPRGWWRSSFGTWVSWHSSYYARPQAFRAHPTFRVETDEITCSPSKFIEGWVEPDNQLGLETPGDHTQRVAVDHGDSLNPEDHGDLDGSDIEITCVVHDDQPLDLLSRSEILRRLDLLGELTTGFPRWNSVFVVQSFWS